MSGHRAWLVEVVRAKGYRYDADGFKLASGKWSHHFVDAKRALSDGDDLTRCALAFAELAEQLGIEFDAVGGLTNGADHIAHAIAMATHKKWFFVRKMAKDRGTRQRIEGATLDPGVRVLLVDDVVTTGGSILDALEAIETETGAPIVGALPLVDRDDAAKPVFDERGIPYAALVTYSDLGIPPVRDEPEASAVVLVR
jgi:orotate phosphoribosyltransferase